jgi:hypothetical protein
MIKNTKKILLGSTWGIWSILAVKFWGKSKFVNATLITSGILNILLTYKILQKKNKYILSSRFFYPRKPEDKQSTLKSIEILKPARIDWTYYSNDKVLEEYKKRGLEYSLTLNPQLPDDGAKTTTKGRLVEYTGKTFIASWMKDWKINNPYWGCINSPYFRELFIKRSLFLIKKEPYALFVDDPVFNVKLRNDRKAGCFCNNCTNLYNTKKANKNYTNYLISLLNKSNGDSKSNVLTTNEKQDLDDYGKFQENSVIEFLRIWKNKMREANPKIIFLTNNYNGTWHSIYMEFDGGIAELTPNNINDKKLDELYKLADSLNKTQAFSAVTEDPMIHFQLMKYNAINDRYTVFAWDIFIPNKSPLESPKRYFMPYDVIKNFLFKISASR